MQCIELMICYPKKKKIKIDIKRIFIFIFTLLRVCVFWHISHKYTFSSHAFFSNFDNKNTFHNYFYQILYKIFVIKKHFSHVLPDTFFKKL